MIGKTLLKIALIVVGIAAAAGALAVAARLNPDHDHKASQSGSDSRGKQLYTCGMHPQVVQDHPGACPICHMNLMPMRARASGDSEHRERKLLYWWDPMLGPSSISDKPAKSAMGMDGVPVAGDE